MGVAPLSCPSEVSRSSSENDRRNIHRSRILSSKLYMDIEPGKVPVIYSSSYNITFMGMEKMHSFDSTKWGHVCQFLVAEGILQWQQIVAPLEASDEDLLVVHTKAYLRSLQSSLKIAHIIEIPQVALLPNWILQKKVLSPFRNQVGGTILGAKLAMEHGWAINIGGGFHHCSAESGSGFCVYADISLCIHYAFARLNVSRVMIIDLDAHQGNGHERDFFNDSRVYILDIFNAHIFPFDLEAERYIHQKIRLVGGTGTDDYLKLLDGALEVARSKFDPQLVIYNAGTDILDGDPLGMLKVSTKGVIDRDEKVFEFAKAKEVPILMVTSGGYLKCSARVIADSITNLSRKHLIHF